MINFSRPRVLCGGDPAPQSGGESTRDMMQAMVENLPALTRVTGENILPLEQAKLDASKVISPQENALAAELYSQYGPLLNEIGNRISKQNQLAAVESDAATLARAKEAGLVDSALALQRQADPEFYKMREALANKSTALLDNMGTGELSPTELEEIARTLNRTNVNAGVSDVGSPTAAVRNALQFGSAKQAKTNSISQALAATAGALQQTRSNFDPFQVATGRSAFGGNTGEQKFQSNQTQQLGQSTLGLSNNLLQQAGENQRLSQSLNAQRRSGLDVFNQTFGSVMSGVGSLARGASGFYKP